MNPHFHFGEVGGAGAGSGAADADLAGGAGVAFGGEGGIFLMPDEDVTDLVVVEDVVEGEGDAARVAEHAIDALAGQAFGEHSRAAHQGCHIGSPQKKSRWKAKKAISRFNFSPPDGLWNSVPAGLSGAGYDDQDANNNTYTSELQSLRHL